MNEKSCIGWGVLWFLIGCFWAGGNALDSLETAIITGKLEHDGVVYSVEKE